MHFITATILFNLLWLSFISPLFTLVNICYGPTISVSIKPLLPPNANTPKPFPIQTKRYMTTHRYSLTQTWIHGGYHMRSS